MGPPGQVGSDAPVVAMEVRDHAPPEVGVDADPVDEHERRPGAPLPVLDRPRRDVDEAAFAELSADRHRFASRPSAGQLPADVEGGAPLRLGRRPGMHTIWTLDGPRTMAVTWLPPG